MNPAPTNNWKAEVHAIGKADLVVGVPCFNNAATIGALIRALTTGLKRRFRDRKAVLILADAGSEDNTLEEARTAASSDVSLITLTYPLATIHRVTLPYHGIPGREIALHQLLQAMDMLEAAAGLIVNANLEHFEAAWLGELLEAVLAGSFDYAVPIYQRAKYDGLLVHELLYPLQRALYGKRIRQPLAAEAALSRRAVRNFLAKNHWSNETVRYSVALWLSTTAVVDNLKCMQVGLSGSVVRQRHVEPDLPTLLVQLVGSAFSMMELYAGTWRHLRGSVPIPLLGNTSRLVTEGVAPDPSSLAAAFQQGSRDLLPVYESFLSHSLRVELVRQVSAPVEEVALGEELWANIIYDFALAHHQRVIDREHLLKSLEPLYLGRLASVVRKTKSLYPLQMEGHYEELCQVFEQLKPYLMQRWER